MVHHPLCSLYQPKSALKSKKMPKWPFFDPLEVKFQKSNPNKSCSIQWTMTRDKKNWSKTRLKTSRIFRNLKIDAYPLKNACDENADCFNTHGSFGCDCKDGFYGDGSKCLKGTCPDSNCPKNQRCVSENSLDCECKPGFSFRDSSVCVDIDECEARVTNALVFLRFRVWEP